MEVNLFNFSLNEEQILILEEELESYFKNPQEGKSWDETKNNILIKNPQLQIKKNRKLTK